MEMADRNFVHHLDAARHAMETREMSFRNLLDPLKEMLFSYEKEVQTFAKDRERTLGDLGRHLSLLGNAHTELKTETQRLISALKQPQARGRWGELTLRRVVEISGLAPRCDFTEQVHMENEEGRFRPDMVVTLPGGGQVVVDAKVPLSAYLDAMEADTEEARKKALSGHARQVSEHVRLLSQKSYWRQFSPSPEFVILFIPGESFFSAALEERPDLLEQAASRNILLATPSTLIAMLKTIALVWREQESYENSRKIVDMAKELHQRLLRFSTHMNRLGQDMEKSVKAFNQMTGSFQRRVLPCLRQFEEMGVAGDIRIKEPQDINPSPEIPGDQT
jgi:DNA recombination protein RmuC